MPFPPSLHSLLLIPLFLVSCASPGTPEKRQEQARRMSHDLQQLAPTVSAREADKLAVTAIEESAKLSAEFKPFFRPWMNNGLVNMGLRKRGLCYQWRDDLFPHLFRLNLKTMDLHLVVSRADTMRQHHGIVVSAKGQRYEDGMVVDPWRNGGRLWWGLMKNDKSHPWKLLPWEKTPVVLRPLLMPDLYPTR